jgi:hypothetical protein
MRQHVITLNSIQFYFASSTCIQSAHHVGTSRKYYEQMKYRDQKVDMANYGQIYISRSYFNFNI